MEFFSDPSFFALLAVAIAGAAALGLTERPLRHYALAVSVVFLGCLFFRTPVELAALGAFLVVSRGATLWCAAAPTHARRFYAAVGLTVAPLALYKVSAVFDQSLWGFVGISYVTFKATQVVIEVHDGLISQDELGLEDWLSFLLFFPQFTEGPIDRSRRFAADAHATPTRDEYAGLLARGILLLLIGAVYKMVLAELAHRFYAPAAWGSSDVGTELLAQVKTAYLYGLYLFFDFAGYSLMAMGASFCLGIRCPRNFRAPFLATDMVDFWNRWHITLSTWFRDFVFMRFTRLVMRRRLIRDRVSVAQASFVVDMLVMGFWHGVSPGYVGYGLYHGVLLAATYGIQKRSKFYRAHRGQVWFTLVSWFVTLQLVILGFALFSGQIGMLVEGALNG